MFEHHPMGMTSRIGNEGSIFDREIHEPNYFKHTLYVIG